MQHINHGHHGVAQSGEVMASELRSVRKRGGDRTVDMENSSDREVELIMANERLILELKEARKTIEEKEELLQGMKTEMDGVAEQLVGMAMEKGSKSQRGRRELEEKLRGKLEEAKQLNQVTAKKAKEEVDSVRKTLGQKEVELREMSNMLIVQSDRLRELEKEGVRKQLELTGLKSQFERARNELESSREELEYTKKEMGAVQTELERTQRKNKDAVQSLNKMADSRKVKAAEYEATLGSKEKELESLRKQLTGAEKELQNVGKQVAEKEELRKKAELKSRELAQLVGTWKKDAEVNQEKLKNELDIVKGQKDNCDSRIVALNDLVKRKDEAFEEMKTTMAGEREAEVMALKKELKLAKQKMAPGPRDREAQAAPLKDIQPTKKAKCSRSKSRLPPTQESSSSAGVAASEPEPDGEETPSEDDATNADWSPDMAEEAATEVVVITSSTNGNVEELSRQLNEERSSESRKPKLESEAGTSGSSSRKPTKSPIQCITIDDDSDCEIEEISPVQTPVAQTTALASPAQAPEDIADFGHSMDSPDQVSKSKTPVGDPDPMQNNHVSTPPPVRTPLVEDEVHQGDMTADLPEEAIQVVVMVSSSDSIEAEDPQHGNAEAQGMPSPVSVTVNEPVETTSRTETAPSSSGDDPRDTGSVEETEPLETAGSDPELDKKYPIPGETKPDRSTLTRNITRRQKTGSGRVTTPRRIPVGLMRHLHHGRDNSKPLFCLCGNPFPTRAALDMHVYNFNREPKRSCDICGEVYATVGGLRDHKERVHSNSRPQTPTAGRKLQRREEEIVELSRTKGVSHGFAAIRSGNGSEATPPVPGPSSSSRAVQYFCQCGQHFPSNDAFLEHMKKIKLEGEFKCAYCPVGFTSRQGMITHQQKYHRMELIQDKLKLVSSSME